MYPSMKRQTHYATLGLAPIAPQEVILAAYKALALIYHPDETLELDPTERAARTTVFQDIQEAFDVLTDKVRKTTYDAELAREEGEVDDEVFAFQYPAQSLLTIQEQNSSMRAQARQQLEHWRVLRNKRQVAEACLSVADLENLVRIWGDLENENTADPSMKAQCVIRGYEYLVEIETRERDYEDSLERTSGSGHAPVTPTTLAVGNHCSVTPKAPTNSTTAVTAHSPQTSDVAARHSHCDISLTPFSHTKARADERKRAEEKRAEEAEARAKARKERKSQIEAARQVRLEAKAALARAQKNKQKAMEEDRARAKAEHIAKVRAKVRGAPIGIDTADKDVIASGVQQESLSRRIDVSDEGVQEGPKL